MLHPFMTGELLTGFVNGSYALSVASDPFGRPSSSTVVRLRFSVPDVPPADSGSTLRGGGTAAGMLGRSPLHCEAHAANDLIEGLLDARPLGEHLRAVGCPDVAVQLPPS